MFLQSDNDFKWKYKVQKRLKVMYTSGVVVVGCEKGRRKNSLAIIKIYDPFMFCGVVRMRDTWIKKRKNEQGKTLENDTMNCYMLLFILQVWC